MPLCRFAKWKNLLPSGLKLRVLRVLRGSGRRFEIRAVGVCVVMLAALAARGETPPAFGRRCIPAPPHRAEKHAVGTPAADCVAPPSNIPDILGRRALSSGRLAALGATADFHHGLLGSGVLIGPDERRLL